MELESALLITVMDRNYDDIVIPMALLLKEGCRMNGRIE
jgi:hypothetical protein